jgi:glycosidase
MCRIKQALHTQLQNYWAYVPMRCFAALLCILSCVHAEAQKQKLLQDVYFDKAAFSFGNTFFSISLDKRTGSLQQLQTAGTNLIQSGETPAIDVDVEGAKWMRQANVKLLRYATRSESGAAILMVQQQAAGYADTVQTTYIIYPGTARLERAVSVRSATEGLRKFGGFYFNLPGMQLGKKEDCVANVPGPFWPATFTPANTPYDSLMRKTIRYHSAPDGGFGIFSLTNTTLQQTATVFMKTGGDAGTRTAVYGNGRTFDLEQKNNKAVYLQNGTVAASDTQCILLTKTFEQALAQYRQMAAQRMPLARATPAWVKDAVILEILPSYFKGGFKEIAQKLPFYKEVGFNTIYLMPHWKGGYSPIDLYQVDSAYGTKEDLQQLVQTAHGLGMRVLFDMVIHGFNTASPIIQKHPQFFYRTGQDSLMIHPAWGSVMTDFMNKDYQQYMKEYVLYEQETFDHDGYRVDAASYKGPNWKRDIPYPAYQSGTASPLLMQLMLDALRKNNKDATLLSEVFGPVFYTVSNFAHDNQTEAMSFVIKEIEKGTYTLAQYKKHLQDVYACLPAGALRVFYTRNHDTSWFYEFFGYTPLFLTLEAIHAFFGVPEIFAGDAAYKFNPDDDAATYGFYKKLFAARKQYPEFTAGIKKFSAVSCHVPNVFAAAAEDGKHTSIFVASGMAQATNAELTLAAPYTAKNPPVAWDIIQQKNIPVTKTKTGFALALAPFQLVVVRLR